MESGDGNSSFESGLRRPARPLENLRKSKTVLLIQNALCTGKKLHRGRCFNDFVLDGLRSFRCSKQMLGLKLILFQTRMIRLEQSRMAFQTAGKNLIQEQGQILTLL